MCKPAPCTLSPDNPILAEAHYTLAEYTEKFRIPNEDHAFVYLHYQYDLIADLFGGHPLIGMDATEDSNSESKTEFGEIHRSGSKAEYMEMSIRDIKQEVSDDSYKNFYEKILSEQQQQGD